MTTSQYSMCVNVVGTAAFVEMYSYHPAGAVTAKQLQVARGGNLPATMEVDYGYTAAGQQSTVTYPVQGQQVTYTYSYDAMGRPASLTDNSGTIGLNGANIDWVQNVQYDFAGRLASWQHYVATSNNYYGVPVQVSTKEARQYNANGQMLSLTWSYNTAYTPNTWSTPAGIQYVYSTTQNNGQITQAVDSLSGETIVYQYDQLKRLTSASSTPNTGSSPTPWTQTFQYDGFGNLTAKVLNGTTTPIPVSATTNRLSNASYDTNGNMTSGGGATMGYDEANRIVSAAEVSGGVEYYGYAPDNKRIYRLESDGTSEDITFYGAQGEKLGMFYLSCPFNCSVAQRQDVVWFAGKLIWQDWAALSGGTVNQDRLGTNRFTGARYYPYGDEITSTPNDVTKFATYNRDGFTGFDYADQRFYASSYGRFNTADPYSAGAVPQAPITWNMYGYTAGDPINSSDPTGLASCGLVLALDDDDSDADLGCGGVSFGGPLSTGTKFYSHCPGYGIEVSFLPGQGCAALIEAAQSKGLVPCPVTVGNSGTEYDCIHRSGPDWKVFSKDLNAVKSSLLKDPNCENFLDAKVGASTFQADIKNIGKLFSLADSISSGDLATTYDVPQATPIIVNAGLYLSNTPMDNYLTILHELAHFFNVITPNDTTKAANAANDNLIMQNCGKTLGLSN